MGGNGFSSPLREGGAFRLSALFATKGVTDIHVAFTTSPDPGKMTGWFRRSGILIQVGEFIDDSAASGIQWPDIFSLKDLAGLPDLDSIPDKSMTLPDGSRLRISVRSGFGGNVVQVFFRTLPKDIPPVASRLADILAPASSPAPGIMLVSGLTGSGKSTLLASMVQGYLESGGAHIVTIEDPIEYLFKGTSFGYASQRDVGRDVPSFAEGVKRTLREDPDVIMVGEIRDSETAIAALTAAETGHMVLATVHAPGCFGAIDRYLALLGSDEYQAMRLSHAYLGGVHIETSAGGDGRVLREYEAFFNNDASRTHIRERKTHQLGQARNVVLRKTLED